MKIKWYGEHPGRTALVLALVCGALCVLAESSQAASRSSRSSGNELGRFEFEFNPVGFLQFGPIVDFGVRVGPVTFIDAHFRYPYLGVVSHLLESDVFNDTASPNTGAIGVRINNVIPLHGSMNAWYIGLVGEYTWGGSDIGDEVYSATLGRRIDVTYTRKWKGYMVAARAGFRWRFASGFYMNLGGILGVHNQYEATYNTPTFATPKGDDAVGVMVAGMIEFSLGVEF
jgi:hypothetical protein